MLISACQVRPEKKLDKLKKSPNMNPQHRKIHTER